MQAQLGCLDVDTLVAMLEGTLAVERGEPVVAHVDGCDRCAEVVSNLGALEPRRVDRYRIDHLLGVGGMGVVYAAYDPKLQRKVAVKLVRPEHVTGAAQAAMIAEARMLARISHPHVVTVYDVGEHGGEIYIATELVEGMTLDAWQARPRTAAEIVGVWLQVVRGLAAAHALEVVHRDVKPSNVLVGDDGRVRIGDFGLARRGASPARVMVGTPAYMAPEHRAGRAEPRSDQFSACVAIVEALTGQRPEADVAMPLEPPALAAVLWRGLRADPAERYPTMAAFGDALAAAIAPSRWGVAWVAVIAALAGALIMALVIR